MRIVLDANILVRLAKSDAPQHQVADESVTALAAAGHELRTLPQSLYEFWVVATRPTDANGLGMTTGQAIRMLDHFGQSFPLLNDREELFGNWRKLVERYEVRGKPAHDARLAAAMQTHEANHLLTFNARDFTRYPHVAVLVPAAIVADEDRGTDEAN